MAKLREAILDNIPEGFEERMSYGMIGYVVPHSIYPAGYHCDPKLPLPFMNIASQKNFIAVYHMGIYSNTELLNWFTSEYIKRFTDKLNMGKGCVRFKKMDAGHVALIGELAGKTGVENYIAAHLKARLESGTKAK